MDEANRFEHREPVSTAERGVAVELVAADYDADAYLQHGAVPPPQSLATVQAADAILFGATGGPAFDAIPGRSARPAAGWPFAARFDLYADIRPVGVVPALVEASSLKPSVVKDVDLVFVRELTTVATPAGGVFLVGTDAHKRGATDRHAKLARSSGPTGRKPLVGVSSLDGTSHRWASTSSSR